LQRHIVCVPRATNTVNQALRETRAAATAAFGPRSSSSSSSIAMGSREALQLEHKAARCRLL
jgi:hypothetical protein